MVLRYCLAVVGCAAMLLPLLSVPSLARRCSEVPLRVAIDVGHSATEPGATSARGKPEYEFNKRFADELVVLSAQWPDLAVTLLDERGLAIALKARTNRATHKQADVLVSIHHDSAQKKYMRRWQHNGRQLDYSDQFSGFSLFVATEGEHFLPSVRLAGLIASQLIVEKLSPTLHHAEAIPGENRALLNRDLGVYKAPFAILKYSKMPAVLLEVGVIANRAEELRLEDQQFRTLVQTSVLRGLQKFCKDRG
jgi:N-acetylmuramoyl-L-alanine amidase